MLNCLSCACVYPYVFVSVLYLDWTSGSRSDDSHHQTSLRPPGTQLVSNLPGDKKTLLAYILICVCLPDRIRAQAVLGSLLSQPLY